MFYIVYNSRTWLGDTAGKIVFCNVADVRPGSNIRTEADTDDAIYTHFFKPTKDTLVFIWIVGGKSRGNQKRYFLTFCQINKEFFCVIVIASGIVFAGIKAGTTTDAFIPIDLNNSAAVLEDHFPKIRKAHVVVEYGRPIYINELAPENKKQLAPYVQQIISDTYFKNKEKYAELMAK